MCAAKRCHDIARVRQHMIQMFKGRSHYARIRACVVWTASLLSVSCCARGTVWSSQKGTVEIHYLRTATIIAVIYLYVQHINRKLSGTEVHGCN